MTEIAERSQEVEQIRRVAGQLFAQTNNYQDLTLVHLAALTGRNVYWLERYVFPPPQWTVMRDTWAKERFQPVMENMYQQARTREDFSARRIAQLAGVPCEVFKRLLRNEWQQRLETLPTPRERLTTLVWQLVEDNTPLEQFSRKYIAEIAGVTVSGQGKWFAELYRTAYLALQQRQQEQLPPCPADHVRLRTGIWVDLTQDSWDFRLSGLRMLRQSDLRSDIAVIGWPLLREELRTGDLAPSTIASHHQAFLLAGKLLGDLIPDIHEATLERLQQAWITYTGTVVLRRRARMGLLRLFEVLLASVEPLSEERRNELYRITGWLRDFLTIPHDEPASAFLSEEELNTVLTCCFADIQAGVAYMESSPDLRMLSGRDRTLKPEESARAVIYWAVALMLILMSCTGLRRQSILSLEVGDWVEIRAGVCGLIWRHWKKGEEHLAVISPIIAHLLTQYVAATADLRTALRTQKVFLNGNWRGLWGAVTSAGFENRLREFAQRHQIRRDEALIPLGSTLFRRTFTTRALYEGQSLEALRSQPGHTTIMSTLLYSKLDLFEHPSQVRTPLDVYGRQVLSLWKAPQLLSELEPAERAKLLKNSVAHHQDVGLCRYDRCAYLAQGSPPPCSLCEHLVTGRMFLPAWYEEQAKREQALQRLAEEPHTEVVYAQMKGQLDHFKRNLVVIEAERKE